MTRSNRHETGNTDVVPNVSYLNLGSVAPARNVGPLVLPSTSKSVYARFTSDPISIVYL